MSKKIMYATAKVEGEIQRIIHCKDLDKTDYDSKYKNQLTCLNGCKARIKFTQRKNNMKFFSTWNKEGKLHEKYCPYYVEYKGLIGREKLNAFYKNIELDDEIIFDRLKRKYSSLNKNYNGEELPTPEKGSREVKNKGISTVETSRDSLNGEKSIRGENIRYKDANYVTEDDIGSIMSVYGEIDNTQIEKNNDGTVYAYLNLKTKHNPVNILLSESFYSNELTRSVSDFEKYIENIKRFFKNSNVIAYGEITKKKRNKGVNVSVVNPKRILIENKSYNEILSQYQ